MRHWLLDAGKGRVMGELIKLEYDGIFAQCACGSDAWHVLVDKPGNFTRLEGVICVECADIIRFEETEAA